jgi:membrane-associated phospholipid phosphatase
MALIGGWQSGLRGTDWNKYIEYLVSLALIISTIRLVMVRRKKFDWDVSKREKRVVPLILLVGFVLLNAFIMRSWHSEELFAVYLRYLSILVGFSLLTLKMKVSGHMMSATLASELTVLWFGKSFWPVLFVIPTIGWARVYGKNHSLGEVIAGLIYGTGMTIGAFVIFA